MESHTVLKEKLTMWDIYCTILILIGTVLALCFGDKSNSSYTLTDLLDLYSRIQFLIFVGLFAATVILMSAFLVRALYRLNKPETYDETTLNAVR
jgi:hypothetical protein